jgi:hypothetical protein
MANADRDRRNDRETGRNAIGARETAHRGKRQRSSASDAALY